MPTILSKGNILVIGALGQIGSELIDIIGQKYGKDRLIASDIRHPEEGRFGCDFVQLDVLDREAMFQLIESRNITVCFNLAAILSATGEKKPELAWKLNMGGLLNTLEAARHTCLKQIFWPSSIAVFGPHSPQEMTPQYCAMDPTTVYGISKLAGERWCEYYALRYGVDVRSIRYPGLISYKTPAGGGTTDYAVEIFQKGIAEGKYEVFLREDTRLPMMYMPDAIRATLSIMEVAAEKIKIRSSYNLAGVSFTPAELCAEIQTHFPNFTCTYKPDFRQAIADSWAESIDESEAKKDWDWKLEYDMSEMVSDIVSMIE